LEGGILHLLCFTLGQKAEAQKARNVTKNSCFRPALVEESSYVYLWTSTDLRFFNIALQGISRRSLWIAIGLPWISIATRTKVTVLEP